MSKQKKFALISVSDKSKIENIANYLVKNNFQIISTGGTYKTLKKYEREFVKEINELSAEQKKLVVENSKIASQVLSSYSKTI